NREDDVKTNMFAIAAALAVVPGALAAKDTVAVAVASAETQATAGSGADGAVVVADPARPLILAGAESAGIDVFDLSGRRVATHKVGDITALDLRADAAPGGGPLLAALDGKANAPKLFRIGAGGVPTPLGLAGIAPEMTVAGLCFSRSHRDGTLY